jgi:hypothetical protein
MQICVRIAALLIIVAMGQTATAAPTISFESLLNELIDVSSIASWPAAEFRCRQASSYDRATVAPDQPGWFANDDFTQFIRKETNDGRAEQVMIGRPGCDRPILVDLRR